MIIRTRYTPPPRRRHSLVSAGGRVTLAGLVVTGAIRPTAPPSRTPSLALAPSPRTPAPLALATLPPTGLFYAGVRSPAEIAVVFFIVLGCVWLIACATRAVAPLQRRCDRAV